MSAVPGAALRAGLRQLGLKPTEPQIGQLLAYLDLLAKWNKVYNLTALRDPAQMLSHHLLDCLAVIPALRGVGQPFAGRLRLLDVGSGGGLPGIVIAICCPGMDVDCVDTVAKKAAFVQQVAVELKLPNLRGLHARVENLGAGQGDPVKYKVITSRAFASLADFVGLTGRHMDAGGVWLAMKGKHPDAELAELAQAHPEVEVFHVEQLAVPGLDAERCIVWMRKT